MAAITWRNVNAPNYGAANALLQSGNRAMSEGINSFGDTLTAEGDRRKVLNTDKAKTLLGGISGLDNYAQRRQEIMAGLGANVDEGALNTYADTRKETLQKAALFDQESQKNVFELGNQQEVYDLEKAGLTASTNKDILANKQTKYEMSPEYLTAQSAAATLKHKRAVDLAEAKERGKSKGGNSFSDLEKGPTGSVYQDEDYKNSNEHTRYQTWLKGLDQKGKDGKTGWIKDADGNDVQATKEQAELALQKYRDGLGWDYGQPNFKPEEVNAILADIVNSAPLITSNGVSSEDAAQQSADEVAAYIQGKGGGRNKTGRPSAKEILTSPSNNRPVPVYFGNR